MGRKSLQTLIDGTPTGGTLDLYPGEYLEQVVIRRPMSLVGRGRASWIGHDGSPVVSIECSGVVLRNLMVEALSGPSMPAVVAQAGTAPLLQDVYLRGDALGVPAGNLHLLPEPLPAPPPPLESGSWSLGNPGRIARRIDKLMDQAEQLECSDDLAGAAALYEDVLELQEEHEEATRFLKVLRRKLQGASTTVVQLVQPLAMPRRVEVQDAASLQAALQQGKGGETIVLAPGIYCLSVVLDKDLFLQGEGSRDQVVLEATEGACVHSTAGGGLRRLTLRKKGGKPHQALIVEGTLRVEECDVSSEGHAGIEVGGGRAAPYVVHTTVHDCVSGILIHDNGGGTFENCDIFGNKRAGVEVKERGNPTVRDCKIRDSLEGRGVLVWAGGTGTFENCEIFGNKRAGIEVKEQGNPNVRDCEIYDSREDNGVIVGKGGLGTFENCDIFANQLSGIGVREQGNPTVRSCKIHDSREGGGVFAAKGGLGTFENCDIFGNKRAGILVSEQGNPTVRGCTIHHSRGGGGVFVYEGGLGTFESCDIFGNKRAGVEARERGCLTVRSCKIHDSREDSGVLVYEGGGGNFTNCDILGNKRAGVVVALDGHGTFVSCRSTGHGGGDWQIDSSTVCGSDNRSSDNSLPKALR
jgi:parallel beta-helix repeat protein